VCTLALVQTAQQSLGHIEGRYGYAVVPGALLALFTMVGSLEQRSARVRRGGIALLALAALAFLAQTAHWDGQDKVLRRIERALRQPRVVTVYRPITKRAQLSRAEGFAGRSGSVSSPPLERSN
jgi:hypothetical protein